MNSSAYKIMKKSLIVYKKNCKTTQFDFLIKKMVIFRRENLLSHNAFTTLRGYFDPHIRNSLLLYSYRSIHNFDLRMVTFETAHQDPI